MIVEIELFSTDEDSEDFIKLSSNQHEMLSNPKVNIAYFKDDQSEVLSINLEVAELKKAIDKLAL